MGWKKLTVIVVAAIALVGGAMALAMHLIQQPAIEMEVPKPEVATPQAGDTTTLADMENMPIYYDDTDELLMPLRNVVESLGGSVKWDTEQKATEISFRGKKLLIMRGSKEAKLNEYPITLSFEPKAINGCLYVSADIFSDYFASEVIWDSAQRVVTVKTGENTKPIIASRSISGKDGERFYEASIPVIVGLNDISYEKRINEDIELSMLQQLVSFKNVLSQAELEKLQKLDKETKADTAEATTSEEATTEEITTEEGATEQNVEQAASEGAEPTETTEPEQTEEVPAFVRMRYEAGYCGTDFISLYYEVDKGTKLSAQSFNIDLTEQKYVSLSDLTTAQDLTQEFSAYAEKVDVSNYFISVDRQCSLIQNQEDAGVYHLVLLPQEVTKPIWKNGYQYLITMPKNNKNA